MVKSFSSVKSWRGVLTPTQWRNYNFLPTPPANIRYGLTVLIHNSGHFGPPLPFWAPGIAGAADG